MPFARLLSVLLLVLAPLAQAQPADTSAAEQPAARSSALGAMARGVVWRQPDSLGAALRDLRAMRDAGVSAVRTGLVTRAALLRAADLYDLAVYQDLPVSDLPAARLADTLAYARRELQTALTLARQHPSARAFGLARFADTSTPEACAYFQSLADLVQSEGSSEAQTYYLSRFVEDDACAESVDLVLLDARERDPLRLLARWRAAHETPVGIGSFGSAVDDEAEGGYRTPHSLAAQGRFLEDGLDALFAMAPPPTVLFVFRWRDGVEAPFGLFRMDDTPRPALDVLRGFYTGRQRVFAFDAGEEPVAREGASTFVLIGWALVIALAVLLSLAPRFRQIAPRYFTRHAYYRDSIQRGRGVEGGASFAFAAVLAVSAGVIGALALQAAGQTVVIESLVGGMQPETQARVVGVLATPLATIALVSVVYAVWLLLNMLWLLALTGRRHRIRPAQALTLAVWSRWQVLVLMVAAVLLAAQSEATLRWVPLLLSLWVLAELAAGVRMLYDFGRVTRVPMTRALVLGLGVPLVLAVALGVGTWLVARPELSFLWHLATRQ